MIYLRRGWGGALLTLEEAKPTQTSRQLADEQRIVQAGVYEGGGALWECAKDLIDVLQCQFADMSDDDLRQPFLRVLELGCGKALPALKLAELRSGMGLRTELILQDLNEEVFWNQTIPAIAECGFEVTATCVVCDWTNMLGSLSNEDKFDIILSSETVYRTECFESVTNILRHCMLSKAYFSQKRYYFGLGGGSLAYVLYLKTTGNDLNTRFVKAIEDGNSNVRDVFIIEPLT